MVFLNEIQFIMYVTSNNIERHRKLRVIYIHNWSLYICHIMFFLSYFSLFSSFFLPPVMVCTCYVYACYASYVSCKVKIIPLYLE